MISRRVLMKYAANGAAFMTLGKAGQLFAAADDLQKAINESDLIYLTNLRSDGGESKCQSEVWFTADDSRLFVVTATHSWRVRAVKKGLTRARIWVGDVGNWRSSDGKYKSLPSIETSASIVSDAELSDRVLERFGAKYSMEWLVYGPRFRNGLKEGSRTMLQYRPLA